MEQDWKRELAQTSGQERATFQRWALKSLWRFWVINNSFGEGRRCIKYAEDSSNDFVREVKQLQL